MFKDSGQERFLVIVMPVYRFCCFHTGLPSRVIPGLFLLQKRREFFITFLPLLILVQQKKWFNTEKIVKNFIYFATIVNLACLVFPRIGINPFDLIYIETITVNHFLFIAHNAAGGFIAVLLALNIGFFSLERVNRQKGKC